ncbi:MAG: tyrosine-type recombinase/integrase [Bacilli bacterium]|nr:tyrosine-type recombinase/integrase [Bacilli bacterium]MDD4794962.1 tyrosine-type recombinase/integrase [Bacilli bacterium]
METKILIDNLEEYILELQDNELAKKSYSKYKYDISKFIKFLGDKPRFIKNDYLEYIGSLIKKEYKISSVNSYIVSINKYLIYLKYENLKIKTKKVQRKQSVENVISIIDYKRLLRISKKNEYLDTYWILRLIAGTGIRVSEVQYFTIESLSAAKDKDNVVMVNNKGKWREVSISTELIRNLLKHGQSNGIKSGYLFLKRNDPTKPITPNAIWKRIQKIAGIAKINKKYAHPHSLRHLFAKTYLSVNPGEYMALADLLGHEDVRTTAIYTQESRKEKKAKVTELKL